MKSNDLKLNVLSENNLSDRELKELRGGGSDYWCHCLCQGPSSQADNCRANAARGLDSPGSGTDNWKCRAEDTSTTVETEPGIEP